MSLLNISPVLSRLSKCAIVAARTITTSGKPLQFGITNVLFGEPLKKKKRIDPSIIRHREEKKKKKLEKSIRRLEKLARQLKPISETLIPLCLKTEKEQRTRKLPPLSEEEEDERISLQKEWSRYKHKEYISDVKAIDRFISSQYRALNELRAESENLYQEAIQIDLSFLPFVTHGPSHTPAIKHYDSPDGEYMDKTIKYPGET